MIEPVSLFAGLTIGGAAAVYWAVEAEHHKAQAQQAQDRARYYKDAAKAFANVTPDGHALELATQTALDLLDEVVGPTNRAAFAQEWARRLRARAAKP